MIETEAILWASLNVLSTIEQSGAFADRIQAIREEIKDIAAEMRTYNDQFETEED